MHLAGSDWEEQQYPQVFVPASGVRNRPLKRKNIERTFINKNNWKRRSQCIQNYACRFGSTTHEAKYILAAKMLMHLWLLSSLCSGITWWKFPRSCSSWWFRYEKVPQLQGEILRKSAHPKKILLFGCRCCKYGGTKKTREWLHLVTLCHVTCTEAQQGNDH